MGGSYEAVIYIVLIFLSEDIVEQDEAFVPMKNFS